MVIRMKGSQACVITKMVQKPSIITASARLTKYRPSKLTGAPWNREFVLAGQLAERDH